MTSVLGIVLARGGSKRVPNKNIRLLHGQPLLFWTLGAAKLSRCLNAFAVSSDSQEILDMVACDYIYRVKRPPELATDDASSYGALLHAYHQIGERFDFLCLLQPTSPFRMFSDIDACITMAKQSDMPAVVSVEGGKSVPNGAVYVGRTDWLFDGGNFDGEAVERYYMPASRSLDIDTEADFQRAEEIMAGL